MFKPELFTSPDEIREANIRDQRILVRVSEYSVDDTTVTSYEQINRILKKFQNKKFQPDISDLSDMFNNLLGILQVTRHAAGNNILPGVFHTVFNLQKKNQRHYNPLHLSYFVVNMPDEANESLIEEIVVRSKNSRKHTYPFISLQRSIDHGCPIFSYNYESDGENPEYLLTLLHSHFIDYST